MAIDALARIDRLLADPVARSLSRSSVRSDLAAPRLSDEERDSILSTIGRRSVSGLGYVADLLDKFTGSRALRGVIGGEPRELLSILPGSDVFGITDPSDIVRGKDIVGSNNPDTWSDDIAGFALEVLLDPTLPFTGFLKGGLSAAGKLAKSAGALDDVVGGVSRAASRAGEFVGPRQAAMQQTLRRALDDPQIPGGNIALRRKLEGTGQRLTDDLLDMPIGGNLAYGVPFGAPAGVVGRAGGVGEKVARGMDIVGDVIRHGGRSTGGGRVGQIAGSVSPVPLGARLLDATVRGRVTTQAQEASRRMSRVMPEHRASALRPVFEATQAIDDVGVDPTDLRGMFEGTVPTPANLRQPIQVVREAMEDARQRLGLQGGRDIELDDDYVQYFARFLTGEGRHKAGRIFDSSDPSQIGREEILKNIRGGTNAINKIATDPVLSGSRRKLQPGQQWPAEQMRQYLNDNYGQASPNDIIGVRDDESMTALARWFADLDPKHAEEAVPVFGNHPLIDARSHLMAREEAIAANDAVLDAIAQFRGADPNGVRVDKLLSDVKLDERALSNLSRRTGVSIDELRASTVPADVADDLTRMREFFRAPQEAGDFMRKVDSITNLFKAGVLTWPARYVRDLVSGQVQNNIIGEFSVESLKAAKGIINGTWSGVSAIKYPLIRGELRRLGMRPTETNARKVLQRHIAEMELIGSRQAPQAQIGTPEGVKTLADLTHQLPGHDPLTLRAAARHLKTGTKNPLDIRGVGGRTETEFGPAAMGNDIGVYTDTLNRLAPYLKQLERGVNPFAARAKVMAAQVDYSARALTPTERAVMKRLAPFYSFTRGIVPFTLRELTQDPSGRLAQAVRGTARLRGDEDFTPEHISQSLAIPVPGAPEGFSRYLTGMGLMHEDPLSLFRPGQTVGDTVSGTLGEFLGRANPLAKAPIELATDRQLFTGREMKDLDSPVGRILSNTGVYEHPPAVPLLIDQVLANSPLARALSSARTATDTRKGVPAKALNLLTGMRLSDVDTEKSRGIALREALEDILRAQTNARQYTSLYARDEDVARMDPYERMLYQMYQESRR